MHWYLDGLKQYVVFSGRARRKEYWFYQLFNCLFVGALLVVDSMTGTMRGKSGLGMLSGLFVLATLLPSLAVLIRRLHDTNRSGWWCLVGAIPLVGPIIILAFTCMDSEPSANEYGPNPKAVISGGMAVGGAFPVR
jgi:uncharacterized membrane protein YhaH (DUF805 family)